jgi:hypothetical protein
LSRIGTVREPFLYGLVGAAPLREPGDSPEMDGGIEQNPAYGAAQAHR